MLESLLALAYNTGNETVVWIKDDHDFLFE